LRAAYAALFFGEYFQAADYGIRNFDTDQADLTIPSPGNTGSS
jgi:hypothetical protein